MKNIRLIIMLCIPLLWLAGCDKNDLEPGGPGGVTTPAYVGDMKFEIGLAPLTRVATGEDFKSAWEDGDAVGIFAVERSGGSPGTLAPTGNYIHNIQLTYNAGTWSADNGVELWWPKDGTPLDFYAYFPYDDNGGSPQTLDPTAIPFSVLADQRGTTVIAGTDVSNYNLSELMSASADNSGAGYTVTQTVPLTFSHSLALVQVAVYGKDFDADKLTVTLNGVAAGASLDLGADGGTRAVAEGGTADVSMALSHEQNSPVEFVFRALVPAQEIEQDGKLFTIVYDGTAYNGPALVSPLELEPGRAHLYSRNINVNGIFTAAELVEFSDDWNATADQTGQQAVIEKWSIDGTADGAVMLWANLDMLEEGDFTPIGNTLNPFIGTFDGNGYTISGLTVNVTGDYAGLFGFNSGTVRNIILEDCDITASDSYAGGIVGKNAGGTISGCQMKGGEVTAATQFYSGGIAGYNSGTISDCYITGGEVTAGFYAGGIAGGNVGTISGCDMTGGEVMAIFYAGGIAGDNVGTISGCDMTGGEVKVTRDYSGGITGYNTGSSAKIENCTVSGTAKIEAENCAGGIAGRNDFGTISGCDMTGGEVMAATQFYSGGIAGYNSGTISGCQMIGGQVTATQDFAGGIAGWNNGSNAKIENCTVSGAAKIETENNAGGIAGWNDRGTISGCQMTGGEVKATQDYAGGIAGQNDQGTISGCRMTGGEVKATQNNAGGIAGVSTDTGGLNDNLIENCTVSGTAKIEAENNAGGIAGWNDRGTISGCQMTGGEVKATQYYAGGIAGNNSGSDAKIENCTVSGTAKIEAQSAAGGIAGASTDASGGNDNLIENCTVSGTVKIEAQYYSGGIAGRNNSGTISGCDMTGGIVKATQYYAGGIAGENSGSHAKIENCTVSGTANIEAQYYSGGIAGMNDRGTISGCEMTGGEVTATQNNAGGIAGQNDRGTISGCQMTGGEVKARQYYAGGIAGASMDAGGGIDNLIENCTVSGTAKIEAENYSGGIAGMNDQGTITACISAPANIICTGSSTGVLAGENYGNISTCYWAEGVVAGNPAVGTGSVSGGDSFDKDDMPPPGSFFTTGSPSPIGQMNQALQTAGSQWRWKAGDAGSGWYPVAYQL